MGLRGDVAEVQTIWRAATWRAKIYLALSLFLASTSIASLSETVFRWKGFVLDALIFYRAWIAEPVAGFISHLLAIRLTREFADHFTVSILLLAAVLRGIFFVRRKWSARIGAGLIQIAAYLSYLYGVATGKLPSEPWFALGFYVLMVLFGCVFLRGATRLLWVVYLFVPPVAVAFLAAVTTGLTRSAA